MRLRCLTNLRSTFAIFSSRPAMRSARSVSETATSAARVRSSRASSWAMWRMPSAVVERVASNRLGLPHCLPAKFVGVGAGLRDDDIGLDACFHRRDRGFGPSQVELEFLGVRGHRVERALGPVELFGERVCAILRVGGGGAQLFAFGDVFAERSFQPRDLSQGIVEAPALRRRGRPRVRPPRFRGLPRGRALRSDVCGRFRGRRLLRRGRLRGR